jgi:ABC-type glycerol-3-phosphate transport system substrate-binding protein
VPVVSTYNYAPFYDTYRGAFTSSFESSCDIDLTGDVPQFETYLGFARGAWSMKSPQVRALFELVYRFCQELPHGFNGMDRQQAGFLFVQGRAAFLTSGAWDARSLAEQAKGRFTVAICQFPMPAPGEPFGQYVQARTCEQMNGGTPMGVYRGSRHPDVAIDFLRYLTSRAGNEKFARLADWPPVVLGAEPSDLMKPFMPDPIGFKARLEFDEIGFYPKATYRAELPRYLNGEISYEQFARAYEQSLANPTFGGDRFIGQEYDKAWRNARMDERLLAIQSMLALAEDSPVRREVAEAKYRRLLQRQVLKNNGEYIRWTFERIRGKPVPPP